MPCPILCAAPAVLAALAEDAADVAEEAGVVEPEAAAVVADIDPELDMVLDNTPVMLEDMPMDMPDNILVVLTPAGAAVVETIIVLLAAEDV